ncbi:hypothetical protein SteCoe_15852 [Stentor coeruleus]|uniref:TNFR-Cys domain-containing protein n=1 Tax=Stentor coeruleus TaxID=5963 RepID=A0A1R2C2K1_9CILI|nr:hypothetical protein SteCoe_15852 [Stentor coeruleus]
MWASLCDKILEYKLGKNFGRIIYDYSGNARHAVNGNNSLTFDYDTIPTDRGAFFAQGVDNCISLPPNDITTNNFYLTQKFSIVLWVMVGDFDQHTIFYRESENLNYALKIKREFNTKAGWIKFKHKNDESSALLSASNSFPSGDLYLGKWQLLICTFDVTELNFYINGVLAIRYTSYLTYSEDNVDFKATLGSYGLYSKSFNGYLWYFVIFDYIVNQEDFYKGFYEPGNCLVESCPSSCNPSIVQDGIQFCLSDNFDNTQNGARNNCPSGCNYGCSGSVCLNCESCMHDSCEIIENEILCLCLESSSISNAACTCPSSFYFSLLNCLICHPDCSQCDQENICLACIAQNSSPSATIGCVCNDGYFGLSMTNSSSCLPCNSECKTCYQENQCLTCNTTYSNPNGTICTCPENSYEINYSCICDEGYFMEYISDNYVCSPCHDSCLTCFSSTSDSCINCLSPLLLSETSKSCSRCLDSMYFEDFQCKSCASLCLECISLTQCTKCVNNTIITDDDYCTPTCQKGYYQEDGECVGKYFSAVTSVSNLNKIGFLFLDETENVIDSYLMKISLLPAYSFSYKMFIKNSTYFYLTLEFGSDIPEKTKLIIDLSENTIFSKSEKMLDEYIYNIELYEYSEYLNSAEAKTITKSVSSGSKAITTISIGSGIISNPSAVWSLINTIQIISYISLGSAPLTPRLKNFLGSFGQYNIAPNVAYYIFAPNSTSEPYLEARRFGLQTSVFWLNTGSMFTIFFVACVLWPVLLILSKFKLFENRKLTKIIENYRYSFFIRFIIQTFLDVGIYAIIQIRSVIII